MNQLLLALSAKIGLIKALKANNVQSILWLLIVFYTLVNTGAITDKKQLSGFLWTVCVPQVHIETMEIYYLFV